MQRVLSPINDDNKDITQIKKHKSENETGGARRSIIVDIIAERIHRNQKKGLILQFKEDPYKETIELVKLLGLGCYGEVWKGKEKSRKRDVAVKIETKIASYSELHIFLNFHINDKYTL